MGKITVILCALLFILVGVNSTVDKSQLFSDFLRTHNKHYPAHDLAYRFGVFASNLDLIEKHNKEATFQVGITRFADMTREEYIQATHQAPHTHYMGDKHVVVEASAVVPPDSLDWREKKDPLIVGPVREASKCADELVVTILDAISSEYSVAFEDEFWNFNASYVENCDGKGCGSDWNTTWNFVTKFGVSWYYKRCPVESEPDQGVCISGYDCVKQGSELDLQAAVATHGPIVILIDASETSFQLYRSGIYYTPTCDPTHPTYPLLLVGYGRVDGQDFWIARNSWGKGWGENGDIRIARNKGNHCGIASNACYARNVKACLCL